MRVKSDVPIAKAILVVRPVNRKIDQLALLGDGGAYNIKAVVRKDWVMEITSPGSEQYTNAKPLIITNAADFTSVRITQNLYDPIRKDSNITTVDAEEIYAFTRDILSQN